MDRREPPPPPMLLMQGEAFAHRQRYLVAIAAHASPLHIIAGIAIDAIRDFMAGIARQGSDDAIDYDDIRRGTAARSPSSRSPQVHMLR